MKMFHLTTENCPICSARTVSCSRPWKHVNGSWEEQRKYECGLDLEYVPNFDRQREIAHCKNDGKYKNVENKRLAAIVELEEFVSSLKADDEFVKAASRCIGTLKLLCVGGGIPLPL